MKGRLVAAALLVAFAAPASPQLAMTDAQVRQLMIDLSIAEYLRVHGPCPCPYSLRRDRRECGDWSAWSQPGSQSPLCYPEDISAAAVTAFRATGRL